MSATRCGCPQHRPVGANEPAKLRGDPDNGCRRISLKYDICRPLRTRLYNRQRQPHVRPLQCGVGTDNPGRTGADDRGAKAARPGCEGLLKRGGELGVGFLEGPGRTVQVLTHACEALDYLGGAGAELGV